MTALMTAAFKRFHECVSVLIANGADVNATDHVSVAIVCAVDCGALCCKFCGITMQ